MHLSSEHTRAATVCLYSSLVDGKEAPAFQAKLDEEENATFTSQWKTNTITLKHSHNMSSQSKWGVTELLRVASQKYGMELVVIAIRIQVGFWGSRL